MPLHREKVLQNSVRRIFPADPLWRHGIGIGGKVLVLESVHCAGEGVEIDRSLPKRREKDVIPQDGQSDRRATGVALGA